ncbi:MAG: TIGR01459 family HAD-type hydrolase [Rhodobacteraceae bacterium]|nr:TIGR01459 family HAD-type hydrolase [Paracoccaceae bacterium]
MTQIIQSFDDVAERYDAAFVDLWGCMHNGLTAYQQAVRAMRSFRARGGKVVLLTNSPRPRRSVEEQISQMGVPNDAWDVIASSGDSARAAMFRGIVGKKVFFIGENNDNSFFEPLALITDPVDISIVSLEEAEGIICTGPFDAFADPDDLRPQLLYAKQKGLKLLCANPDIVVDRGETREWCAGAVAQLYTKMGGTSLYFGKPHPPIYDLARRRLAELGDVPGNPRIIGIGDGIRTDIQGAMGEDIDSLFITGGLAAGETQTDEQPEQAALDEFLAQNMLSPTFAMGFLR